MNDLERIHFVTDNLKILLQNYKFSDISSLTFQFKIFLSSKYKKQIITFF